MKKTKSNNNLTAGKVACEGVEAAAVLSVAAIAWGFIFSSPKMANDECE